MPVNVSPNKSLLARASAVLTTGEVAAAAFDLNASFASDITCHLDFTLGMLTNVTIRFYVSADGTTYIPVDTVGGGVTNVVLTADTQRVFHIKAPGWAKFRATLQGSGTVTNSLAALTYRYLRRGTQM